MSEDRLSEVPLGARVVVRYLIEDGERATDVLGSLTGRSDTSITVEGPSGPVEIPTPAIVAGKPIPSRPPRRPRSPQSPDWQLAVSEEDDE